MASEVVIPLDNREQPEAPTELAALQIRVSSFDLNVSARGTTACRMALGVIGPAVTIMVGHLAGFPVWAVILLAALQVLAAALYRGGST